MKLNPTGLRSVSDITYCLGIRCAAGSPLLLCKSTGEVKFASGRLDKDKVVAEFDEAKDLLIWSWHGNYGSDMFQLSKADIDKHYK